MAAPPIELDHPVEYPGVHNVVTFAEGLYSGSVPMGAEGFETLRAMGVKTIISVDGAAPEVESAKKCGMRYVHLPIGYNGMDRQRTLEIARTIRDLPGPVYVHCHHGRHRSAGALGAAIVTLGLVSSDQATQRLMVSGTSPSYPGLYRCVALATVASAGDLDAASNRFPETWKTSGLVKTMVEIDAVLEYLKVIEEAGWVTPPDHPDLVPAAEAGRLADLLRNLQDDQQVKSEPVEFSDWLRADSRLCERLEEELVEPEVDRAASSRLLREISQSCRDCHVKYRDVDRRQLAPL